MIRVVHRLVRVLTPPWVSGVLCLALAATRAPAEALHLVTPDSPCRYLVPADDSLGLTWTAETGFDDSGWTPGAGAIGYQHPAGVFTNLIQSTVPVGALSFYARWAFTVTNAVTANAFTLRLRYDDGFVAYLNGERIAAANSVAAPAYNTLATAEHPDALAVAYVDFDIAPYLDALHPGTNVLAVQAMNFFATIRNADMLLQPELMAATYIPAGGHGVVINEIHCDPDNRGEAVRFVELYNPATNAVNLTGWTFASGFTYRFLPGAFLAPGGYAVVAEAPDVFSNKFHVAAYGPFTGTLKDGGEDLVLHNGLGEKVDEVAYDVGFPWPTVGEAPGPSLQLLNPVLDNDLGGSWRSGTPTPGASNSVFTATNQVPPHIRQVDHSPNQPITGEPVTITAKVTDPDGVAAVTLDVQLVDPGAYIQRYDAAYSNNWTSLPMTDDGTGGDAQAGDNRYTVQLPAAYQVHRRLVRYRITVSDNRGNALRVPYADDPQPNFAYFVYDGVPAWTAALQPGVTPPVTFGTDIMGRLPAYHLIARKSDVEDCTWFGRYGGEDYPWTGTMVYDGKVYDHIGFRARGGVWRYAMVKNMWKFRFNRGHYFAARDDYGRLYNEKRDNLNFSACIQQADQQHRGEHGMFEAIGFRLFNLAGAPSSKTHWVSFRVIDADDEDGATQYEGDFWGVYLAVEQLDGHFLDDHDLPDGNIYKWEYGPFLGHQGHRSVSDGSDVTAFVSALNAAPNESWWRLNANLDSYYGYRAIVDGIHHYDFGGKNWYYYFDPTPITNAFGTGQLCSLVAWDLDLTWANNMYSAGDDPFREHGALNSPAINTEYQNRVREIRDLLFNTNEAWRLINEYAAVLAPSNGLAITDADRAMWDYNPVMINGAYSSSPGKAGQGLYYGIAPTHDFAGMVQLMRDYVAERCTSILDPQAADAAIPYTPTASAVTNAFPVNNLRFRASAFADPQGAGTFAAMRWRLGEVTDTNAPAYTPGDPQYYEIEATWDSGELTSFADTVTLPNDVAKVGHAYRLRLRMKDNTGRWSHWSAPMQFVAEESDNAVTLVEYLRISELMFAPPGGNADEFIELVNISSNVTMSLNGATFTAGIDYTFPVGALLPAGARLLLAGAPSTANFAAFRTRYGLTPDVPIVGPFDGNLNNGGEMLTLKSGAAGSVIVRATYGNGRGWPTAADGAGHSLVPLVLTNQSDGALDYGGNWRASTYRNGSPGTADPAPIRDLLLNEIVAHTDYTNAALPEYDSNDWLELFNAGPAALVLTNWYLSDDPADLDRWPIPPDTTIPVGGRRVFSEVQDFHQPITSGFGLNKAGERVFLSYLPGDANDRVVDCVAFKGQENDIAWGRSPDGDAWWRALAPTTSNAANAEAIASIVISELMPHPAPTISHPEDNTNDEYIELHNPTAGAIGLWSPEVGPWRLAGGVSYVFPTNTTLASGEHLVVVNFDPVADPLLRQDFVAAYGLTNGAVRMLGPYGGKLANGTERIAVERGVAPDAPGDDVAWCIVDEAIYATFAPWPTGVGGTGRPLQRRLAARPGSDPANWSGTYAPSPGAPAATPTNEPPYVMWQRMHFGDTGLDGSNPDDDWDHDGVRNWDEYVAGTDPADEGSRLTLAISNDGTAAVILWPAVTANGDAYIGLTRRYDLLSRLFLPGSDWTPVINWTNLGGIDGMVTYTNTTDGMRFYRVRVRLE